MKEDEFIDLADKRLNNCMKTMGAKSDEYSRGGDKLHNFKQAARMLGCTPEEALMGMATKHIVSVYDMVRDVAGGAVISRELVEEKIGDVINYMLLLEAILTEEFSEVWDTINLTPKMCRCASCRAKRDPGKPQYDEETYRWVVFTDGEIKEIEEEESLT